MEKQSSNRVLIATATLLLAVAPCIQASVVNVFLDDGRISGSSNTNTPFVNNTQDSSWDVDATAENGLTGIGAAVMTVRMVTFNVNGTSRNANTGGGNGLAVYTGGNNAWLDGSTREAGLFQLSFYSDAAKTTEITGLDITFKSLVSRTANGTTRAVDAFAGSGALTFDGLNILLDGTMLSAAMDGANSFATESGLVSSADDTDFYIMNGTDSISFTESDSFWVRRRNLDGAIDQVYQLGGLVFDVTKKQVIFLDTFDTADTNDINAAYVTRQSNGLVTSSYTESHPVNEIIENNALRKTAGGTVETDTNFASYIIGTNFEWSVDIRMDNTNTDWIAVSLVSANEDSRSTSPLTFLVRGIAGSLVTVQSTDVTGTNLVTKLISTSVFNTSWSEYHNFKFVVTEAGDVDHVKFLIDGEEMDLGDNAFTAFSEDTTRKLNIISLSNVDVSIDNLTLVSAFSESDKTFEQWAVDNSLAGDDALRNADPDIDGMDNLLEYALGGDPNVDDADAKLPVFGIENVGGTNWFGYLYNRRIDAAERGLDYGIILNTDLVSGTWTNIGISAETGTAPINSEFELVTNVISTLEEKKFVGLEVTEN